MDLLFPLAQTTTTTPAGFPEWLWLMLVGLGGFAAANAPWVRAQLDAVFKERRQEARKQTAELNERLLTAQETTAKALSSIAESNKATADALNIFASHWSATSLHLDEIRRELRRLRNDPEAGRITPKTREASRD